MKWEWAFCGDGGCLWEQGPCDVKCSKLLVGLRDVGGDYLWRWEVAMGLGGLPISKGGKVTLASAALATSHLQMCVCVSVCWGPEQWLFLPELGVRRQLCLLSWDP